MALDVYRERKHKVDCCPCCCPVTEAPRGCCCCSRTYSKAEAGCCAGKGLKAFIVTYYIPLLRNKHVKAAVLVFFTLFSAGAVYCASNLKQVG